MTTNTDCEYVVVGAGVVGLAIAARLARDGRDVLILEREADIGTATSARNSEVIHAGIYYPADSLKARLCVTGKQMLYDYCRDRHINHRQCGKLIVATSEEQVGELESIRRRALANGVDDIRLLTAAEAKAMEPELACLAALHSPSTGIIDSHGLMISLLGDAERQGAVLATRAPVTHFQRDDSIDGFQVSVGGEDAMQLSTRRLINTAGHGACELSNNSGVLSGTQQPVAVLLKGNYFRLAGRAPFTRLIYPVPEPGGLGVHITIDLGGQARFGPDVEPVESLEYAVDAKRAKGFYEAIRRYWPGLQDDALTPDYSGIRPKISVAGELQSDFVIQSSADHGVDGLINLFGIESPGLTASLAIAECVTDRCLHDQR